VDQKMGCLLHSNQFPGIPFGTILPLMPENDPH